MRKYIIGTIIGFVLATSASANAQGVNRLIDSVVQGIFNVSIDGESVGEAIVVNDKTYLPVREFGEAVGYNVSFSEDREVILTKNPSTPTNTTDSEDITKKIDELNKKIKIQRDNIETFNLFKSQNEKFDLGEEEMAKVIKTYKDQIANAEARIADYQSQIAALEAQK